MIAHCTGAAAPLGHRQRRRCSTQAAAAGLPSACRRQQQQPPSPHCLTAPAPGRLTGGLRWDKDHESSS
eukprot:1159706-Pelagomonas_calceolata.AAC.3